MLCFPCPTGLARAVGLRPYTPSFLQVLAFQKSAALFRLKLIAESHRDAGDVLFLQGAASQAASFVGATTLFVLVNVAGVFGS